MIVIIFYLCSHVYLVMEGVEICSGEFKILLEGVEIFSQGVKIFSGGVVMFLGVVGKFSMEV